MRWNDEADGHKHDAVKDNRHQSQHGHHHHVPSAVRLGRRHLLVRREIRRPVFLPVELHVAIVRCGVEVNA